MDVDIGRVEQRKPEVRLVGSQFEKNSDEMEASWDHITPFSSISNEYNIHCSVLVWDTTIHLYAIMPR